MSSAQCSVIIIGALLTAHFKVSEMTTLFKRWIESEIAMIASDDHHSNGRGKTNPDTV